MTLIQIIVLSLIQGLTEFLPISSTAHLIIVPETLGWQDPGLAFDVAVHLGTLFSVITYFRKEIKLMLKDGFYFFLSSTVTPYSRIFVSIMFATIPVGLAGLVFHKYISEHMRTQLIIAASSLTFAFFLGYAALTAKAERDEYAISTKDVLLIGFLQILALVPGVSRSGITITGGLLAGFKPEAAARYSFLLGIPVILLAGALETRKLIAADINLFQTDLFLAMLISGFAAYACIHLFMKLLNKIGYMPFVVYRIFLSIALLFMLVY